MMMIVIITLIEEVVVVFRAVLDSFPVRNCSDSLFITSKNLMENILIYSIQYCFNLSRIAI